MPDGTLDLRNHGAVAPETNGSQNMDRAGRRLHQGEPLLAWDAPEHVVYKKTTAWYIAFGIVWALLLFTAIVTGSFLTGIVFFIGGILLFLYSERAPRMVHFEILDTGIAIGRHIFPYRELMGFNLMERIDGVYILLRGRRLLIPLIHVPVADDVDPRKLQKILARHVKEDDTLVEPLSDIIAHWLGF